MPALMDIHNLSPRPERRQTFLPGKRIFMNAGNPYILFS
jgi:hypothetical protein